MTANSPLIRHLLAGTAIAIAMSVSLPAYAQEATQVAEPTAEQATTDQATELKPITVTGKGARVATSPLTETVERAEIQERMVTDFQDFSRRIDAGVNFNTQNNSINIRGLQANRVLTTLDGIRVPWLTDPRDSAQGGLNAFDFDSLSQIDITKGADSSRYGSGALGGVVELRTLDPEDLIEPGKTFGAITKATYDSANTSILGNAAVATHFNDTWLLFQGGYKHGNETKNEGDVGGYGTSRTEANPMDFNQGNFLAKIHQYIDGGHRIGLTGEYFNLDEDTDNMRGTTASYEPGSLKSGEEINRRRISASYDFISPDGTDWVDTASLVAYWQKQKLNNTTDGFRLRDGRADIIPGDPLLYGFPTGVYKRDNLLEQTTYGVSGDASKDVQLGGIEHGLRFGGELYGQKTHQYSWGQDNCPDVDWTTVPDWFGPQACRFLHSNASDMPDVDSAFFGIYLEDDIKLLDNRLTLTPGLRFDWYRHSPKSTAAYEDSPNFDEAYLKSSSDSRFSPKLRAAWQATTELELYAQWAQGFRAPSATELYQNYGQPGSYARVGNPNLEAETSNGFEIGAKYDSEDYTVQATVFNNYYRNFIDMVQIAPPGGEFPIAGITGYENLAHVQIYGVEFAGEWRFTDNWRTWGSLAWSHGQDTDTDEYLNSVAPLRAILGLGYAAETWGSDVSLTMAAARNKVSGEGFKAPGYGIVDATVWWEPEQFKGLKLQAGVFNIFDKTYWNAIDVPDGVPEDQTAFYSETGRSFRFSITKKF
ncbi:TonB-dependent hemoglobin/transferrin/lactoferrin family receptor [Rhizobiaceae bacterium n13]|uniref:TonB-dependent hemoglobin/transferrin/lactoferrin family receptor n=1 Tax=Ferirhizobium litorale TaxID=2927786 RepID=A0AAE3Q9T6_9HYPH|nr:TonB-dependent hemoglobin/transferrin/lactoferrin family receptor [Fererhizobium litorale]MDI7860832.1 TonB-dependent hemoglobin/transferrin/lactoferrin family receptor [Fererhizobium litorale]MDI7920980.1 TonB-dependent hemoglobin/transferrin/lactoferrin family receptor [Fererhizobium litorale]